MLYSPSGSHPPRQSSPSCGICCRAPNRTCNTQWTAKLSQIQERRRGNLASLQACRHLELSLVAYDASGPERRSWPARRWCGRGVTLQLWPPPLRCLLVRRLRESGALTFQLAFESTSKVVEEDASERTRVLALHCRSPLHLPTFVPVKVVGLLWSQFSCPCQTEPVLRR